MPQVNDAPEPTRRHDIIWAPWRLDYVIEAKTGGCFLCDAVAADDDAAHFVVERRDGCFSILNRYPYNNGHTLIAPNAHKADLPELTDDELAGLMRMTRDTQRLLADTLSPHGFNIGVNLGACAGAGVPGHLHLHIVPRWNGDTNFMPVTAETKIIVQSLGQLYALLRQRIESQGVPPRD